MIYEEKTGGIIVYTSPNADFPPHIHRYIEMTFCTHGTIIVTCNDRTETLCPGDVVIIFQNDIHQYINSEYGRSITIMFDPNFLSLFEKQFQERKYENFLLKCSPDFLRIAEIVLREYQTDRSQAILHGYVNVLWGMAMKILPCTEYPQKTENDLLLKALKYISMHYRTPISLKMVAKEVGVDPCHLSRTFSQKIPCGFLRYVQEIRMEYAKELLIHSAKSIYVIAEESGFPNLRSFNRIFKNTTGMSPGEYRKNIVSDRK